MEIGFVGLGRMGFNMVTRLARSGHRVVGFDRSSDVVAKLESVGATGVSSLDALIQALTPPRAVWLMVPAGAPTESTIEDLRSRLAPGDTIIDGGNTNFQDDVRRATSLAGQQITYIDAGTSGGIWGLQEGYCLMVGGEEEPVHRLEPIFRALAPHNGYAHVGGPGAGHFTKMVHNGIEYGLMQAYAEGFEVLQKSEFGLDLHEIAGIWRYGSVVRSWLLDLLYDAFEHEGSALEQIQGWVEDSGEGRWTIAEAIAEDVPVPVISAALFARFSSRQDESFAAKVNAALRKEFGGHAVKSADET
jgi:6-phosphogluconate dehydrogenase